MLHDHATVLMHESLHHDTQVVSLNKRIRGLEARNQFLNEKLLNVHNLWTCEMCGFSMHAEHHNEDGTYSCPVCAEQELFAENWNLKTELKKKSELIAIITKAVNE
jgi:rubrerythrin